ncbi:MAG: kelch repeat-containing protein [Candidatus Sericytochromatia bacterium]|nr:kelch repeat-containing protein [Candidatus Sericytochromatia bacterium]
MKSAQKVAALAMGVMIMGCGQPSTGLGTSSAVTTRALALDSTWQSLPALPTAGGIVAGAGVGLRLLGVEAEASRAWSLAPRSSWTSVAAAPAGLQAPLAADLPPARVLLAATAGPGKVLRYDFERLTWDEMPDLPQVRAGAAMGSWGHLVYYVGGLDSTGSSRRVDVLNASSRAWSKAPDLPIPRIEASCARLGARMFVGGGYAGAGTPDGRGWILDPMGGTVWQEIAPMPTPRRGATAVAYGYRILVIGGRTASGPSGAVESFDLSTGTWTRHLPLPEPRVNPVAGRMGERLVIFGGRDGSGRALNTGWAAAAQAFLP